MFTYLLCQIRLGGNVIAAWNISLAYVFSSSGSVTFLYCTEVKFEVGSYVLHVSFRVWLRLGKN